DLVGHGLAAGLVQLPALLLGQPLEVLQHLRRLDGQGGSQVLGRVELSPVPLLGKPPQLSLKFLDLPAHRGPRNVTSVRVYARQARWVCGERGRTLGVRRGTASTRGGA